MALRQALDFSVVLFVESRFECIDLALENRGSFGEAIVKSPEGLVSFFQLLLYEQGGPGVPSFLSSHPATEDRIAATRAEIARLEPGLELRDNDGGKLEIIQRRIELITGRHRLRR